MVADDNMVAEDNFYFPEYFTSETIFLAFLAESK